MSYWEDSSRRALRHKTGQEQLRMPSRPQPAYVIKTEPKRPEPARVDLSLLSGLDSLQSKFGAMAVSSSSSVADRKGKGREIELEDYPRGDNVVRSRSERRHRSMTADYFSTPATTTAAATTKQGRSEHREQRRGGEEKNRHGRHHQQPQQYAPAIPSRSTSSVQTTVVTVPAAAKIGKQSAVKSPGIPRRKPVEANVMAIPVYDNGTAASYQQAQQLKKYSSSSRATAPHHPSSSRSAAAAAPIQAPAPVESSSSTYTRQQQRRRQQYYHNTKSFFLYPPSPISSVSPISPSSSPPSPVSPLSVLAPPAPLFFTSPSSSTASLIPRPLNVRRCQERKREQTVGDRGGHDEVVVDLALVPDPLISTASRRANDRNGGNGGNGRRRRYSAPPPPTCAMSVRPGRATREEVESRESENCCLLM